MSGLKNTVKRSINASLGRGWQTRKEARIKRETAEQAGKDKVFAGAQMPDEEEIARNERRKAAKRRGSRVNTVLTDADTLG